MNKNITAIVFTLNEERRIQFVIDNLKDYCNVIVFDGGSADGTERICNNSNVTFLHRPEGSLDGGGGVEVYRWVYERAPTEYVLHVYCSHFYPTELLESFNHFAKNGRLEAVYHDVLVVRYGKIVHRPLFKRTSSACVFYKKSIITFDGTKIHDELAIKFNPNKMVRLQPIDELSLHVFQDEDYLSTENKHLRYSKTEASQIFKSSHRKIGCIDMFLRPLFKFVYYYFRSGAFVNGAPGLIYAIALFQYDLSKNIFLWEMQNSMERPQAIQANDSLRWKMINQSKYSAF
ncbi:hypothetical protein DPM18_01695 [Polynucleobacter paneuropaeus]|uniref:glycosyltransferase n=1 Tax=Polynucleobacter paneuropaeus TaxID=2527775 RepID=UPI000DBF121C|nr:glycosyltransferase [Polynucleobacter paneuropaeus]AWW45638.1 hypothetical protein DPM18_01695 [Polynucleobacter paneuropaeus]